jgi:UTP-glucose-1-phosphate uridylyltransferase
MAPSMKKVTEITKAVFPVAGLGTRFLPATKAQPKEMLPVVDRPLIQYAVEEAYAAGIRHMIFVTGRNKRAIEDHFDTAYELETELESSGKHELLALVRSLSPMTWTVPMYVSHGHWGWAMPCCAHSRWWAMSLLPCCWPTI